MSTSFANWLLLIVGAIFVISVHVWVVQNGHPEAVWFYCDMLNLCGATP